MKTKKTLSIANTKRQSIDNRNVYDYTRKHDLADNILDKKLDSATYWE